MTSPCARLSLAPIVAASGFVLVLSSARAGAAVAYAAGAGAGAAAAPPASPSATPTPSAPPTLPPCSFGAPVITEAARALAAAASKSGALTAASKTRGKKPAVRFAAMEDRARGSVDGKKLIAAIGQELVAAGVATVLPPATALGGDGTGTASSGAASTAADLVGVINITSASAPPSAEKGRVLRITLELSSSETTAIVWSDAYVTKPCRADAAATSCGASAAIEQAFAKLTALLAKAPALAKLEASVGHRVTVRVRPAKMGEELTPADVLDAARLALFRGAPVTVLASDAGRQAASDEQALATAGDPGGDDADAPSIGNQLPGDVLAMVRVGEMRKKRGTGIVTRTTVAMELVDLATAEKLWAEQDQIEAACPR